MIADVLDNFIQYQQAIPRSKEIINYLASTNIYKLENGRYPVAGESVFFLVQEYQTKPESEKRWESHRKYIDIQIVLSGWEYMGYCPVGSLQISDPYDEEKDIIFYEEKSNTPGQLYVSKGQFCVFFPDDAHKPGFHRAGESHVKKALFKVLSSPAIFGKDQS